MLQRRPPRTYAWMSTRCQSGRHVIDFIGFPFDIEANRSEQTERSSASLFGKVCCSHNQSRCVVGRTCKGGGYGSYRRRRGSLLYHLVGRQGSRLLQAVQHQCGDHTILRRAGTGGLDNGRRNGFWIVWHGNLDAAFRAVRRASDRRHHGHLDGQLQNGRVEFYQIAVRPEGKARGDGGRKYDRLSLGFGRQEIERSRIRSQPNACAAAGAPGGS